MDELDGVLDRDDVVGPRLIDVVDDRGERGRLARAGRAGHEDEPLREIAEPDDRFGKVQLLGREDLDRDLAEDGADAVPVAEDVDAEARDSRDLVGEVGVVSLGELRAVQLRKDGSEELLDGSRVEDGLAFLGLHVAVDPEDGTGP